MVALRGIKSALHIAGAHGVTNVSFFYLLVRFSSKCQTLWFQSNLFIFRQFFLNYTARS